MNVAVAGANGFIGRRAVAALAAAGHDVRPYVRADLNAMIGADHVAKLGTRPSVTVESAPSTRDAPRRSPSSGGMHDVLVWCAGNREKDLAANVAVHADFPIATLAATRTPRIVYLSTGEVYGDAALPYREDMAPRSTSDYARAKLEGEHAVTSYADATILRIGLGYGPDQSPRMLIPRLVAALRANERFPLTHGEQTRDLVFVDDVAQAIVAAVASAGTGIFNIASGIEVRIRDVCEGIARAIATQQGLAPDSLLELLGFGEVALRPDEAHRYVMDVSRARAELGWTATTTLAEGFALLARA